MSTNFEHNDDNAGNLNEVNETLIEENLSGRNLAMGIFSVPMLMLLGGILGLPVILLFGLNITVSIGVTILAEILVVIIALFYTKSIPNWKEYLRLNNFNLKNVLTGILLGLSVWCVLQFVSFLIGLMGIETQSSDTSQSIISNTGIIGAITMFFIVPVVVPFVEELFFRGAVLRSFENGLKTNNNKIWAIVLSSILFGLAHFQGLSNFSDVFVIVWITSMSLVMGFYAVKTNSIWTSFFIHATYNLTTIIAASLLM